MNILFKAPMINKKLLLGLILTEFKLIGIRKVFSLGTLICLSASSIAVIAESSSYQEAKNLIAYSSPTSNYQSPEIEGLQNQLFEKIRELQEYKSKLFQASTHQDQAKIIELTRKIVEQEKNKNDLSIKIQEIENQLIHTKKQMQSLEVSAEALTDYIQSQRLIAEKDKQALISKIQVYEQDTRYDEEQKLNQKLINELMILKANILSYETRLMAMELSHEEALQDTLQETAMLKFELADTKQLAAQKEYELIISSLNEIAMNEDHKKILKTKQLGQQTSLESSKEEIMTLKSLVDEITTENIRLQRENTHFVEQDLTRQEILKQHFAERHVLANQLLEKEEALTSTLIYYQEMKADHSKHLDELKNLTHQDKYALLQHEIDKHVLENALVDLKENQENELLSYQLKISNHATDLQLLQERLALEETLRVKLLEEKEILASEFDLHKQGIEPVLAQKEEEIKSALTAAELSSANYIEQINSLIQKLAQEQEALKQVQHAQDVLYVNHTEARESFEKNLKEKEEALASALLSSQNVLAENQKYIEDLKNKLINEETLHQQLQITHGDLESKHSQTELKLSQYETEKLAIEHSLLEKEESLNHALNNSQMTLNDYATLIEELKERLTDKETIHHQLRESYDQLSSNQSEMENQLSQKDAEKVRLEHILQEKEETLNSSLMAIEEKILEYKSLIQSLQEKISKQEKALHETEQSSAERLEQEFISLKEINELKNHIAEDSLTIDYLRQEISKLNSNFNEKSSKEDELEKSIYSLTKVAEHQDHALAEANSAFSLVQEYNHHLELENAELKKHLDTLETAERTLNKHSSISQDDEDTQSVIPPALFRLLRTFNK